MKAQIFAAALSLLAVNLSAHANTAKIAKPEQQTPLASKKIDLNKVDVSALIGSFKGIGKKRAEAIIAYRTSHQGFKSIEELAEVKGIGQRFVTANKEKLKEIFIIN
ncbi:ComEA family DNA-binding protein [Legionella saoudiensis]|uniref:ComEA family DNA-binding protein n=1 Tax=Legionella saoudiensis TaxID=1750561 RepID=UPI0007315849|nr:helix-hairpin-helix domain-containing protein [Legionella saoudiensis]